jgi:diamine N-acetyltransferase
MKQAASGDGPDKITLREITAENLKSVLALSVSEDQRKLFPRSNAYSIAEGHYPADDDPVWMRAIYAGETPVGFLMTSEAPDQGEYFLWRLMIDARYQGNGYGSQAVARLIERLQKSPGARVLLTSHMKGEGDAGPFYRKLGFVYTGQSVDGREPVMMLDLRN